METPVLFAKKANYSGFLLPVNNTARNLYQLNANEVPLTLHYGFEGSIIILHKNPYRWRLQNGAETVGNIVIYYLKMTLMLIEKVL